MRLTLELDLLGEILGSETNCCIVYVDLLFLRGFDSLAGLLLIVVNGDRCEWAVADPLVVWASS